MDKLFPLDLLEGHFLGGEEEQGGEKKLYVGEAGDGAGLSLLIYLLAWYRLPAG